MKHNITLICAALVALTLAGGIGLRSYVLKRDFDKAVDAALKESQGYDEQFVQMVNRLEDELALRASFGYSGGKDPMTGRVRRVALPPPRPRPRAAAPVASTAAVEDEPAEPFDPVRLTAIIYDDEGKKFTAIVMDGDRSFSVEVGDRIRDRRITRITEELLMMESEEYRFLYTIAGQRGQRRK